MRSFRISGISLLDVTFGTTMSEYVARLGYIRTGQVRVEDLGRQ
jgi:hypothetical protein